MWNSRSVEGVEMWGFRSVEGVEIGVLGLLRG